MYTNPTETQAAINYRRIEDAINYITIHFKEQPNLDEVAKKVNLSPFHFQRLFTDWAGISPKKFLQYLSLDYAKGILKNKQATLFDAAFETGLSGTGRLHDLFMNIEGMTPAEYKHGGKALQVNYSFADSPFGSIIIASTTKGICYTAFVEDRDAAFNALKVQFPNAALKLFTDKLQQDALTIFGSATATLPAIKLHLKGTSFQLKVWEALLKIPTPAGDQILSTYGQIAKNIQLPNANRAVGSAIGDNPSRRLFNSMPPRDQINRRVWSLPLGINPQVGHDWLGGGEGDESFG